MRQLAVQMAQINSLSHENDAIYHSIAQRYGLSDSAFWILYALSYAQGPMTQRDFCELFYFNKQTVNSAIAQLSRRGWMRLETAPGTRKRKNMVLTPQGGRICETVIGAVHAMELRALSHIGEADRAAFVSSFRLFNQHMKEEYQIGAVEGPMIRLLALDLDGTCLNRNNQIVPATLSALKRAARSGVEIVFVTGRAYESLPDQLAQEDFFRYVISSNGACVMDRKKRQVLFSRSLSRETALSVLRVARRMKPGLTAHVENRHVVQGRPLWLLGRLLYGTDSRSAVSVPDLGAYIAQTTGRIEEIRLFFFRPHKRKRALQLKKAFPELHAPTGAFYMELTAREADKGSALEWLYRRLGLAQAEVACIGDDENDIPMFEKSGLRIAMQHALVRLKMLAHAIVSGDDEDELGAVIDGILQANRAGISTEKAGK